MLSNSETAVFCEQSGMILESGLSMLEGISIMEEDTAAQNESYRKIYAAIRENLQETGVVHEALTAAGVFPDYMLQMVKIGEETGNLDEVMKGLAAYYEREENTAQDIKSAVTYPLMILCMMLAILLVMIVKVMPVFNQVYEQLGSSITGPAAVLLPFGEFLGEYWGIAAAVVAFLAAGAWFLLKTQRGIQIFRRVTRSFFSGKKVVKRLLAARISSALSMALRSGMDYTRTLELAISLAGEDKEMEEKLSACRERVLEGETFSRTLKEAGIYSPLQARMLMIAERTGETDKALEKVAQQLDDEVTAGIQNFVSVIEPTMVIVLSVLTGGILLSVMMPLMGILSVIG